MKFKEYITENINDKITKADELGMKAFKKGKKSVPAHDKELMKLIKGLKVGEGATEIMGAWTKAWHKENLK